MIRPIFPPHELWNIILRLYEENPVLMFGIGIGIVVVFTILILFLVRTIKNEEVSEVNKGGEK